MLVRKCGPAGRSVYLESSTRSCATSAASPAAADASSGGGDHGEAAALRATGRHAMEGALRCVSRAFFSPLGGVGTPAWMATGRTRCALGARAIRAPENGVGDGARADRRVSGVGSAAGAAGRTGEKAAENTVGDRLPSARLGGAGGVGLPRASGGDAARFWAGGVGDCASGWRRGGGRRLHRRGARVGGLADAHAAAEGVDCSALCAVGCRLAAVVVGRPLAVNDAEDACSASARSASSSSSAALGASTATCRTRSAAQSRATWSSQPRERASLMALVLPYPCSTRASDASRFK